MSAIQKNKKLPKPSDAHWLFGNMGKFRLDSLNYIGEASKEVGDIFEMSSIVGKFVGITNPLYIKHILQDNNKNYHKGIAYKTIKYLLGQGLLISEGDFWRKQRRLAQPAFHKARLEKLGENMQNTIENFIVMCEEKYADGAEINISQDMNRLALLIVANALFRTDISQEIDIISENLDKGLKRAIDRIQKPWLLPLWMPTPSNLKEQRTIDTLSKVIENIILKRKKENKRYDDLLDMLMYSIDEETGETMSDQQLRDEVMTVFMAGHETTANALAYAFYLLSRHKEADTKLYEEVGSFLAENTVNFRNIKNLPYTQLVIKETLRVYPPAWVISRRAIANDKIGAYAIEAGTNVIANIYVMHHSETYWESPEKFMPERFKSEHFKNIPKYVYFPFGGGPRLCIGDQFARLEMTLALALIREKFYFKPVEDYELNLLPLITLRPEQDIRLKIFRTK